jgi:hypothetical protein
MLRLMSEKKKAPDPDKIDPALLARLNKLYDKRDS